MHKKTFLESLNFIVERGKEELNKGSFEKFHDFIIEQVKKDNVLSEYYMDHGPNSYRLGVSIAKIEDKIVLITGRKGENIQIRDQNKDIYIPPPSSMWSINLNRAFI